MNSAPEAAPESWRAGLHTRYRVSLNLNRHAMLRCIRDARCIPFGENMTTRIFSFSFRSPPVIDAVIRTGIPSRQIR
jgi:hypothetical protein